MIELHFTDSSKWQGSSYPQSQWNLAPDKEVSKLIYTFANRKIILSGYKEYNHCFEKLALQMGGCSKLFLMAREETRTLIISYCFFTKKLNKNYVQIGHEYRNQIITGWKQGKLNNPHYRVEERIIT